MNLSPEISFRPAMPVKGNQQALYQECPMQLSSGYGWTEKGKSVGREDGRGECMGQTGRHQDKRRIVTKRHHQQATTVR